MNQENPLKGYFRQPGKTITLPSQMNFYDEKIFDTTINGEVKIYPMTAQDELILKNPDSLLNNDATEQVLKSCVQGLTNPRKLLSPDVETLLLAIRFCTYGKYMGIYAKCQNEECGEENYFDIDIEEKLNSVEPLESEYVIEMKNGLKIYLKPYDFEDETKISLITFEEYQLYNNLRNENLDSDDENVKEQINEMFYKIRDLTFELLTKSIIKITIEGENGVEEVTEKEYIREFLENTDTATYKAIDEKVSEINQAGINKTLNLQCRSCGHQWKTDFTFDAANFFEQGS